MPPAKCDLYLAWPLDLVSADPHALIVFGLEQANWYFGVA
jgi:hypothetical protein